MTPSLRWVSSVATRGLLAVFVLATVFFSTSFRFGESRHQQLGALTLVVPTMTYGLEAERFAEIEEDYAGEGEDMNDVLLRTGLNRVFVDRMARLTENKAYWIDLEGRPTTLFRDADGEVQYVAQEVNDHEYVRVDIARGEVEVADQDGVQAEFETVALFYDGDIDSMLVHASFDEELMERVRRGLESDTPLDPAFETGIVRLIYSEKHDEQGQLLGYGNVEAVRYRLDGEEQTAIRFSDDRLAVEGFFKPDGSPVQRTWLTNPVPGSRLSSPYNLRRRHPVLKRVKPHFGTDYAAPYGTPILAVSDGVITARARTRGNGKYIKMRHDDTYESQYLHMKAFAKGIKPGVEVKKGQVIGYVGSTGLASGPHVCFRFWKHGTQVDHRAENLATAEEIASDAFEAFAEKEAELSALFDTRA